MKTKHYLLTSGDFNGSVIYIDYDKLKGFRVQPRNQVEYDGVSVNKMILMKPSFIEKVLKRKVKLKLDSYLQYIIRMMEEENNDEDGAIIEMVMNDLERYKRMIINKYRMYLESEYLELLMKKISLLERELAIKKMVYEEPVEEKRSRRSR